jgi:hypothetical protein
MQVSGKFYLGFFNNMGSLHFETLGKTLEGK